MESFRKFDEFNKLEPPNKYNDVVEAADYQELTYSHRLYS
jgi:hypothetical protein